MQYCLVVYLHVLVSGVLGVPQLDIEYTPWGFLQTSCVRTYMRVFSSNGTVRVREEVQLFHELKDHVPDHELHESSEENESPTLGRSADIFDGVTTVYQGIYEAFVRGINLQNRIIGGNTIPITAAPYQVIYDDRCGGAILSPDWVITAAHCGDDGTYIKAGSTRFKLARKHFICAHYMHPRWQNINNLHIYDYDFQLLMLQESIPITRYSMPIAIGNLQDIIPGTMLQVSGWGYLHEKGVMVDALRMVSVPILNDEVCRAVPVKMYNITNTMFCAGYPKGEQDACQGDSGGPAVHNHKLLGLVSFGSGCGRVNRPGVYSKLPLVKDWLFAVTGLPQYREGYY